MKLRKSKKAISFVPVFLLLAAGHWPAARAAEYEIAITKMKFAAVPDVLHVGDVINWRNDDMFRHTATARDGGFDVDLPPHSRQSMKVDKAGSFAFYCRFHPAMKGTLSVQP
ncbi:cupredoxin domain-containing protein [Rhizobium sp. KVB221]|uniref:Cupredoxin domain-containing protein n=1 Tax=Rhizobium setariae TaxID=2801340 RepID=A0A937CN82_9HYPH|nr:cupredoxin domain-containing protein [Rhizobium setariae]MBL0375185.1 cupredoxin domain-containing protein [Rhizobium setariae]